MLINDLALEILDYGAEYSQVLAKLRLDLAGITLLILFTPKFQNFNFSVDFIVSYVLLIHEPDAPPMPSYLIN